MTNLERKIRNAILAFDWHNYGLDEMSEVDPEYANDLARKIAKEVNA